LPSRPTGVNAPDGMSIPEELERRELRLAAIAEAKAKIEAQADERRQAEHQTKLAARATSASALKRQSNRLSTIW
jgi:hypothetical protein